MKVEKLEFGQSSANHEVRFVEPKEFIKKVKQMRRDKSGYGIFSQGPESRANLYQIPSVILQRAGMRFPGRYKHQDVVAAFQRARAECAKQRPTFGDEKYTEQLNFLNTLERTVMQLVEQFKAYDIDGLDFFYNPPGGKGNKNYRMHLDSYNNEDKGFSLSVIYTIVGPSTIYQGKTGREIHLPDTALVGHIIGGATHKTPDFEYTPRLTIAMGFLPKQK